jgi:hypothetical protein
MELTVTLEVAVTPASNEPKALCAGIAGPRRLRKRTTLSSARRRSSHQMTSG